MGLLNDDVTLENETEIKTEEVKKPLENTAEEKADSTNEDDGGMGEFLNGLKNKTDKDELGGAGNSTETKSEGGNNSGSAPAQRIRNSGMNYANHELVAKLTIAAMSVTFGLLLQYVAQDFSEEAEKRYKLSDSRKKELEEPLTLMLEQSKSKYNPAVIFFITVLISYVPLFMGAFRIRKANKKLKVVNKNLPKGTSLQWNDEVKDTIMDNAVENKPVKKAESESVGRKFTNDQQKRIAKIKKQRGRRSVEDQNFINEMGLKGLI